ncbi:hypothetical protein [Desulfomonile tiedjei]|uniref:FeoB-associated Cys-rich membrane protein n=1 Tax=Desulfomonile tiedjei (strain ATCC 49306 / DSM 6799 / DCB-1) TaxID=706587 RepID=I4CDD7_DESTA|nr:hypothetical protein [Desulfomonile tiedjei]AFM27578.1 hypothetical protein Desti_4964 [Desulfomonile tiedjei DSM 6799]
MMETALVIGIVLIAATGLLWSFQRNLTSNKTTCSCGHGGSCGNECSSGRSGSCCNDLLNNADAPGSTFDEEKYGSYSSGKIR